MGWPQPRVRVASWLTGPGLAPGPTVGSELRARRGGFTFSLDLLHAAKRIREVFGRSEKTRHGIVEHE